MKELFVSYLFRIRHDIAFRITLFIGIDPLVDGFRTVGNVVGNMVSAFLLARTEGKVDQSIYDAD